MTELDVHKGMPPVEIACKEFERRYRIQFAYPAFVPLQRELDAVVGAAWDAYGHSRKSPVTRKAGEGFADPEYELSVDWLAARAASARPRRATRPQWAVRGSRGRTLGSSSEMIEDFGR